MFARRFALLSKTIGRRRGGPAVLAAEPAKTEFCLSKGIPKPRPVAGIVAGVLFFVIATRWLAMTAIKPANRYCETVCTTLPTGRVRATGSFISLTSASSYSGKVCSGALAFICTTL